MKRELSFPFTEEEINRAHQYFANWAKKEAQRLKRRKRKSSFGAKDKFEVKGVPFMIWWREEDNINGIIAGRVSIASYTDDPIYQPTLGKMRVTLRDSSLDYEPIDYDEIVDEWHEITNMIRRD